MNGHLRRTRLALRVAKAGTILLLVVWGCTPRGEIWIAEGSTADSLVFKLGRDRKSMRPLRWPPSYLWVSKCERIATGEDFMW